MDTRHDTPCGPAVKKLCERACEVFGQTEYGTGIDHISQRWAPLINDFNRQHLNPYLNFHHPCFFPGTRTDAKGKQRKIYRYENMMMPYDKFKSLPGAKDHLKPGLSFEILDQVAYQISDNQAADQLQPKVGASRRRPAKHSSKPFMDGL